MKHLSVEIRVYEHANHNALSHLSINTEGRLWGGDFSAGQMGTFQSALIRLAIASFIIHYVGWQLQMCIDNFPDPGPRGGSHLLVGVKAKMISRSASAPLCVLGRGPAFQVLRSTDAPAVLLIRLLSPTFSGTSTVLFYPIPQVLPPDSFFPQSELSMP